MECFKPAQWVAVFCRHLMARSWWVAVVWAVLAGLVVLGVRQGVQASLLAQDGSVWARLGQVATEGLWLLQLVWPLAILLVGSVGTWRRWYHRRVYRRLCKLSRRGFDELSWQDFEILVVELFRHHGFEVEAQGGNHADGGIDALVKRNDAVYLVQCKHWLSQRVGVKVVREAYGVVAAEGMTGGYVVSSGLFTPDALEFADGIAMQLIDGQQLLDVLDARLAL